MIFIPDGQTSEPRQPAKEPLDLPATTVPSQRATGLGARGPVRAVRRKQLDAGRLEAGVEGVAVIGLVAEASARGLGDAAGVEGRVAERDFRRRSPGPVDGDRKTRAVCHG